MESFPDTRTVDDAITNTIEITTAEPNQTHSTQRDTTSSAPQTVTQSEVVQTDDSRNNPAQSTPVVAFYVFTLQDLIGATINDTQDKVVESKDDPTSGHEIPLLTVPPSDTKLEEKSESQAEKANIGVPVTMIFPNQYLSYNTQVDHHGADVVRRMIDGTKILTGANGKLEVNPSDDQTSFVINRLVMICVTECMICNKRQTEDCEQLCVGYRWGWLYCKDCLASGRLRNTVLGWINKEQTLPCTWIGESKTFSTPSDPNSKEASARYLKFFRYSQRDTDTPVYEGRTYPYDEDGTKIRMVKGAIDGPGITLAFRDNSGNQMERLVSLENIFAHNPAFYTELTTCTDLLNRDDVKIGYSDISQSVRDIIERSYGLSLVHDPQSYKH